MTADGATPPVFDRLAAIGFVPIVTVDEADAAVAVAAALSAGGLPCMEITFRRAGAEAAIAAVVETQPEMLVGAGTVLTIDQADAAHAAGARFAVTPGFDEAIVDRCNELGLPVAPGVMTPTEVNRAIARGLRIVKFFPAESAGGVAALQAIAAPYPEVRFMPTGGIGLGNLAGYLAVPPVLACGGSWIAPRDAIERVDMTGIERRAAEVAQIVTSVRGRP